MQDLEWQVPDWLFDEMGLAGDWKSENLSDRWFREAPERWTKSRILPFKSLL
ncbi:hypothetical protein J3E68DRAFT_405387 [Trichoderma sp. SZMC 28012]